MSGLFGKSSVCVLTQFSLASEMGSKFYHYIYLVLCFLQAEDGQSEACFGVHQLLPQWHLHTQTPHTLSGAAREEQGSTWRHCTTPNHNLSDTCCHHPSATSIAALTGTPSTATPPTSCPTTSTSSPSSFSPSDTPCPVTPSSRACHPHHPAQPSPVMGCLLRCRCLFSDWDFQAIQAFQPLQPVDSHPVWTLICLNSHRMCVISSRSLWLWQGLQDVSCTLCLCV